MMPSVPRRRKSLERRLRRNFPDAPLELQPAATRHRAVYFVRAAGRPAAVVKLCRGLVTLRRRLELFNLCSRADLPTPRLLFFDSRLATRLLCGGFVIGMEWIHGAPLTDRLADPDAARAVGRSLAALHGQRRDWPGAPFHKFKPSRDRDFLRDRFRSQLDRLARVRPELRFDVAALHAALEGFPWNAPAWFCHIDAAPNNILIRGDGDASQAVFIDIDYARFDGFYYDLCLLLEAFESIDPAQGDRLIAAYLAACAWDARSLWDRWSEPMRALYYVRQASVAAARSIDPKRSTQRGDLIERARNYTDRLKAMFGPA
jgi:thiamine kinase-like enzyme